MSEGEKNVKVAMLKVFSEKGDPKHNIELFEKLTRPLVGQKIDVVVTPECYLDGYVKKDSYKGKALQTICVNGPSDPYMLKVSEIAKKLKSYIVFGASELDDKGDCRNAAFLIGRNGEHVGTYYKVNCAPFYKAGEDLPVFETDFGKVGIVICADRRWPENIRVLKLKGADIILNPTWGMVRGLNTSIMKARAYENCISICFNHPRQALIVNPEGEIDAILESNIPDTLVHNVDLSKNINPSTDPEFFSSLSVHCRKPELYGKICEPYLDEE